MESAEGYEQSLRETKACVGKEWCRHGTIYCAHLADRIEEEFKQIDYPKKLKLGISGCPRSCAEVLTKDFGVMVMVVNIECTLVVIMVLVYVLLKN